MIWLLVWAFAVAIIIAFFMGASREAPTMIAYIGILVLAALLIAFWVWMRRLQRGYLSDLAQRVRYMGAGTDPWEEPQIVATYGGIHDVDQDEWA